LDVTAEQRRQMMGRIGVVHVEIPQHNERCTEGQVYFSTGRLGIPKPGYNCVGMLLPGLDFCFPALGLKMCTDQIGVVPVLRTAAAHHENCQSQPKNQSDAFGARGGRTDDGHPNDSFALI
jgi:hypothetical protein